MIEDWTPEYLFDIEQNTLEWDVIRQGKLTGSDFHQFMGKLTPAKEEVLAGKAAERITGDSDREPFSTAAMERGHQLEPEARRLYEAINEVSVKEVGFVLMNDYVGCSPDGLIGDDGVLEIKCPQAKTFLYRADKKYVPPEHITQCQFNMLITKRQWCDYFVYHPRLGSYTIHMDAIPEYQEQIKEALDKCLTSIERYEQQWLSYKNMN